MKTIKILVILVMALGVIVCQAKVSKAVGSMGTAFTYQGRLIDANSAADGLYDFQFKLFDDLIIGNQVGSDVNKPDVDVVDGYFTVELNFGNVFDGDDRWLEIRVRDYDPCDVNAFTKLRPRQEVTPTPYAIYASSDGDWMLSGNDMYSIPSGNVGIGTDSPDAKLSVIGIVRGCHDSDETEYVEMRHGGGNGYVNWNGDGNLDFRYDGSKLVSIQQDGEVGIGIDSPSALLHLHRPDAAAISHPVLALTNDTSGTGAGNGIELGFWTEHSSDIFLCNWENGFLSFCTSGSDKMRILSNGNVGIGITEPTAPLHVDGTVKAETLSLIMGSGTSRHVLKYGDEGSIGDSNNVMLTNREAEGALLFGTSGQWGGAGEETERMRITYDGEVGIGTKNPKGALDVESTTGAFIVPRMTTAQRNALTAVNGMIIYNTSTNQFNFRENGAWVTK